MNAPKPFINIWPTLINWPNDTGNFSTLGYTAGATVTLDDARAMGTVNFAAGTNPGFPNVRKIRTHNPKINSPGE